LWRSERRGRHRGIEKSRKLAGRRIGRRRGRRRVLRSQHLRKLTCLLPTCLLPGCRLLAGSRWRRRRTGRGALRQLKLFRKLTWRGLWRSLGCNRNMGGKLKGELARLAAWRRWHRGRRLDSRSRAKHGRSKFAGELAWLVRRRVHARNGGGPRPEHGRSELPRELARLVRRRSWRGQRRLGWGRRGGGRSKHGWWSELASELAWLARRRNRWHGGWLDSRRRGRGGSNHGRIAFFDRRRSRRGSLGRCRPHAGWSE
jgi:hypothetical protein